MTENPITYKINRIRKGQMPRVLDLFAGCGGLALGFKTVGFDNVGQIELDPIAAHTHELNILSEKHDSSRNTKGTSIDITEFEPEDLGFRSLEKSIDVIVGGPPCQAFARVGRAKLREIASHPSAFLQDPRSNLYLRYLHFVRKLKPLALLVENVPDVLNFGGHNIPEEMCQVLDEMGYEANYTLLNSAYYGVPQMRERMFLIAYKKELNLKVSFPKPSRFISLPRGYESSRQVAMKALNSDEQSENCRFIFPPEVDSNLPPAISAREAISDLPIITAHLEGLLKRGVRRFVDLAPYRKDVKPSQYAKKMRNWPGFENKTGVYDHVIRYLPRDYPIFGRMNHGDQYPEAYLHAHTLLEEYIGANYSNGKALRKTSKEYIKLKKSMVPPYDPGKFPNKWRKMEPDFPARTLMAHLGKDSYSHIHYDCSQARTISVREAARLQSFPDGFIFQGAMNSAFRQIGNAVPPLLSAAIAYHMLNTITGVTNGTKACTEKVNSI